VASRPRNREHGDKRAPEKGIITEPSEKDQKERTLEGNDGSGRREPAGQRKAFYREAERDRGCKKRTSTIKGKCDWEGFRKQNW